MKNSVIDSRYNSRGTELTSIEEVIEKQNFIEPKRLKKWFWDVFIVDSFIGNGDRHNENLVFLYDPITDKNEIAPVYACGSCLYPQADENIMKSIIENEKNLRVFENPTSGLKINEKKINYFNFISSLQHSDCNEALKRIVPKINMAEIKLIIDNTPYITDLQKDFYKTMLEARKERILDFSLAKLMEKELSGNANKIY